MSKDAKKERIVRGMACPICGEKILRPTYNEHMKNKHPEYFQESRKFRYGLYACAAMMGIFAILSVIFNNGHLALSDAGNIFLIAFGIGFLISLAIVRKLMGLMSKYRDNPINSPA